MGAGIAQLAATHGCVVRLVDVNTETLGRSLAGIARRIDRLILKGRIDQADRDAILERITPSPDIHDLAGLELAIEAVTEDLTVKRRVFAALERVMPATTVLATNTSSLSVADIAKGAAESSRVIGMHFFNPAPVIGLVEVVAAPTSDDSAIDLAVRTVRRWGKVAVLVKDTPGFIVNRVARGFYLEGLRLLGEGVGGVDEIDGVMRNLGKFKMGPFELMDMIGLDVNLAASTTIWERMGRPARLAPHDIQKTLVERGYLGRKSGRGFYSYKSGTPLSASPVDRRSFELSPLLADAMLSFSERAGVLKASTTERYMFSRILAAIINEAGHLCSERVASPEDIDVAMVTGTNYPRGPLAWADDIGHRTVHGFLRAMNDAVSDHRFQPSRTFQDAG